MNFFKTARIEQEELEKRDYVTFCKSIAARRKLMKWQCRSCSHEENDVFARQCGGCSVPRDRKLILFCRHGEGVHNLSIWKAMWTRDALLTERGHWQCETMRSNVILEPTCVDLVLVSPLKRTIQTAVKMFAGSTTNFRLCPFHTEYYEPRAKCNLGSTPLELAENFDFVKDWGGFEDLTELWWPTAESDRFWQTERTAAFRQYLSNVSEQNVAVVGHGAFTMALLNLEHSPHNCEVIFVWLDGDELTVIE